MKFYRPLLAGLLILCAGYYIKSHFFKQDSGILKDTPATELTDSKNDKIQSFCLYGFSETGKKKWEVRGKSADIMVEIIKLWDINAKAYGEETEINLKADKGTFDRRSNDVELKENVVAVTDEGTRLITQKLIWHAKDELIDTDEYVRIERKDMELEGIGASTKPSLKIAQLNKDVKLNLKPATVITCDGPLEIDYNQNVSYFNNNVKLDDGKTQIYADKATAYFDPKRRTLTKVVSEGNVKIIRGEDVTYAEQLTYLPEEGRVILSGRPKIVIQSKDELLKEQGWRE